MPEKHTLEGDAMLVHLYREARQATTEAVVAAGNTHEQLLLTPSPEAEAAHNVALAALEEARDEEQSALNAFMKATQPTP